MTVLTPVRRPLIRPVHGTYLYLATLPFIAGIDRDTLIPLVRPNEAVLVLVLLGALLGGWAHLVRGGDWPLRFTRLDRALAGFALFSTVWPILSVLLRRDWPTALEVSSVLPVCKLVAIYLLVRCTVSTEREMLTAARLIIWPGVIIAVIAALQTLGFGPVVSILHRFYMPEDATDKIIDRGATTLASPIATGDVIVIALVVLACCYRQRLLGRAESVVAGAILGVGVLAAGQFSTWIAAAVVFVMLLVRFPELRRLVPRIAPVAVLIAIIGAPAVLRRLEGFSELGVPESWLGRWDNLSNFFLPRFDLLHIVFGVSPNPVLDAPETWRTVIYLESGYLYFLWIGGIPLLIMFGWLSAEVLRTARGVRNEPGLSGAFGSALEIVWGLMLVLSILDPHITMRGTGDLVFALLALTMRRSHG